ncbi:MAG: RluA family pseudouridine synthase [Clostridia bacterium]|nr:RluA family pseudouridine synthase [Clostridia bacterium]
MELNILYSDSEIFVVEKPANALSEEGTAENSLASALKEQNGGYIGVVHRLDRGVGGVMVYARTKSAAARLSAAVQSHALEKTYLAVIHGKPTEEHATLTDLLYHDRLKNKTFVVDRPRGGVKEAILDYELRKAWDDPALGTLSLVRIRLHTGRTHQIRVQFASRSHPLVGDRKYGAPSHGDIRLFCHTLTFPHPKTGKPTSFTLTPDWGEE